MEGKTLRLPSPSHPLHSHTDIKIHSTHNHMAIGHPTTGTCPSTREPGARTPLDLGLLLTAFMHLELLDDDVSDLLGALGVRRLVLVLIELVVRGSRGGAGDHGPDEVHGGSGERAAGEAEEEPHDHHEYVPDALLGPGGRGRGGVQEIGAMDLNVGGDRMEVVVVAVAVGDVWTEAAHAEDGDDRGDVGSAEVAVDGAVASAGVGVGIGRDGDEEAVARPRVGSQEGRGDNGEEQEEAASGHSGGGEPDLCLGKGKVRFLRENGAWMKY
uniref:Uncharacterized protein n=2 Tax=Zea mays TaxID=4577 RepID=A0A804U6N9_MAIZE